MIRSIMKLNLFLDCTENGVIKLFHNDSFVPSGRLCHKTVEKTHLFLQIYLKFKQGSVFWLESGLVTAASAALYF
jgi:hypothetical protein